MALNRRSQDFAYFWAYVDFTNTFINFVKKFLAGRGIRSKVGPLRRIRALLLLALDLFAGPWLVNSSSFLSTLTKELIQGLYQIRDSGGIKKKKKKAKT